jgi:hypothetical protein
MLSAVTPPQSNLGLRILDPDLPFLASEAAIDIDNLLSNRSEDLTAIRCLAERLRNSIESSGIGGSPRSLMDPATLTVLGEAVAETVGSESLQKVEDLLGEAAKIANSLSSGNPRENPLELEQARDFCVALSKAAIAYTKSIRDLQPSHPFRR